MNVTKLFETSCASFLQQITDCKANGENSFKAAHMSENMRKFLVEKGYRLTDSHGECKDGMTDLNVEWDTTVETITLRMEKRASLGYTTLCVEKLTDDIESHFKSTGFRVYTRDDFTVIEW